FSDQKLDRDEEMIVILRNVAVQFGITFSRFEEKEKAHNSLRAREETLARISHDLQNPLGTILASNEVLTLLSKNSQLAPDFTKFTDLIQKSVFVMQSFIKDLLDFSKMEAGSFKIKSKKICP